MRRLLAGWLVIAASLALGGGLPSPATAEPKTVLIELDGRVYAVTLNVAPGTPLEEIDVPGHERGTVVGLRDLPSASRPGKGTARPDRGRDERHPDGASKSSEERHQTQRRGEPHRRRPQRESWRAAPARRCRIAPASASAPASTRSP